MLLGSRSGWLGLFTIGLGISLVAPEILPGTHSQALAGLILQTNSVSSVEFAVEGLNRNPSSTTPTFDSNDVLIYPGSSTYPAVTGAVVDQRPTTASPAAAGRNYTQTANTASAIISPTTAGTGHSSVSLSSSVPNNGTQAGNAGISFNPGSYVFSSASASPTRAIESVTTATAVFTATGLPGTTLGIYLDAAGYVHGAAGSFVAVGIKGTITYFGFGTSPITVVVPFQFIAAYAGPGTQLIPQGGSYLTGQNAPPGFDFEVIASKVQPYPVSTIPPGSPVTVHSTITLIADPDSGIELIPGQLPSGMSVADFGIYAGGPVGDIGDFTSPPGAPNSVPEPSTLIGLLIATPFARMLYRRHRHHR